MYIYISVYVCILPLNIYIYQTWNSKFLKRFSKLRKWLMPSMLFGVYDGIISLKLKSKSLMCPFFDIRILLATEAICSTTTSHCKKKVRDIWLNTEKWVHGWLFASRFALGFTVFFVFVIAQKKKSEAHGDAFLVWRPTSSDLVCSIFFTKANMWKTILGCCLKGKKITPFFFFYAPPPLFLPWIIKRKLGYFDFEQRIWTIEHFEIKLGLKQAGTANCWKPQSWFPWFQEGERKTWLKVTDPATWRILREWLMCHVFWTGTFGSAISSDSCLGCTVILRERSLRLLLS